jgi:hypothetical protein
VEAVGLSDVIGAVRLGDPAKPDFTVERAVVHYGFKDWSLDVTSVALRRPVLRARLHDGKPTLGALDPLIEEFSRKPPRPGATKPRIEIDGATLLLATDYGPMRINASGRLEGGRLMRLEGASAPARLQGPGFDLGLGAAAFRLRTDAERLSLGLDAPVPKAAAWGVSVDRGQLNLNADLPYPDLRSRRSDGAVALRASLTGGQIAGGGQSLVDARLSAAFTGLAAGWIPDLALTGRGVADLRAASGTFAGGQAGTLKAAAVADDLRWTRKGGDAVSATVKLTGAADGVAISNLRLQSLTAAALGPVRAGSGGPSLRLTASASGHGAWIGLGAPASGDPAEIAAVKRAARGFRFTAPAVSLAARGGLMDVALQQPVRLQPDRGGLVSLGAEGRGYRLTSAGGGLPTADVDVTRFTLVPGGALAAGRIRAALPMGPLQQGTLDAAGTLRLVQGAVSFVGDRCAAIEASRLTLGANDLTGLSGRLCPAGRPLFTFDRGDWRIAGRSAAVAAEAPFLQARLSGIGGPVTFGQARGQLDAQLILDRGEVADAAPDLRFRPLRITGEASLAREVWTGQFVASDAAGRSLGRAVLHQDLGSGIGRVDVDTGLLAFDAAGLQPTQLSPLAAAIGSPVQGAARFVGGFAWTPAGSTSGGRLSVPRLDFVSPAGRVVGLSGEVTLASLTPLVTAPGQRLRADSLAGPVVLTDLSAGVALDEKALHFAGGDAALGGGRVRLVSLDLPLVGGPPVRGVLDVDGVQVRELVKASPFGERVDLDAKLSGRLPFEAQGEKVRVTGGNLRAIQPGRLSIRLAPAASPASGAPEPAPPPPDTFTDFAYQAMENLAFDTLDASVDSRPDGQLGILFHVVGRHDPPTRQVLAVSWLDLIRRTFMNRKLPLPSGTGVNLTLDTTLNLDDLLKDYADYQRLKGSPPVQR